MKYWAASSPGVDFEKRIADIYQNCRTEEEIQASFDELQRELEEQIDERIKVTRQKLLENFDEEVHEKLRINLRESTEYLNKFEDWLWRLTRFYLEPYARFDTTDHSFLLVRNPFPNEKIHPGPYRVGKNVEDANIYRPGHPLAQRIIEACKAEQLPISELVFDYSNTPTKITILESLIGKSGWLRLINLTISSFEDEDHLVFCGICDDGSRLDIEQCQRLFSLPATAKPLTNGGFGGAEIPEDIRQKFNEIEYAQETEILQGNAERNAKFFDLELEKLEKWADDVKNSLEIELKNLDKEIKFRKTEAKKILKLEEKVKVQRQIKEMEKKRNTLRQKLFESQDEVDRKKENLIDEIEARLRQQIQKTTIFSVKWTVK